MATPPHRLPLLPTRRSLPGPLPPPRFRRPTRMEQKTRTIEKRRGGRRTTGAFRAGNRFEGLQAGQGGSIVHGV